MSLASAKNLSLNSIIVFRGILQLYALSLVMLALTAIIFTWFSVIAFYMFNGLSGLWLI